MRALGSFRELLKLSVVLLLTAPLSHSQSFSVGYFNASLPSSVTLMSAIDITTQFSFSFRSCQPGQILSQQGYNGDLLQISLTRSPTTNSGLLHLYILQSTNVMDISLSGADFLSNQWFTADISENQGRIIAQMERGVQVLSMSVLASSTVRTFLWKLNLTGGDLMVGRNYTGCLQQGLGMMFNFGNSLNRYSQVIWGACPMDSPSYSLCAPPVVNPCYCYPCLNGGSCWSQGSNYTCTCPVQFTGVNCETDQGQSVCSQARPCQNNGTCFQQSGSFQFQCQCVLGFTGVLCDVNINDCRTNPCGAGQCIDGINNYTCNCTGSGYSGQFCQTNIDECATVRPCLNGATCLDTPGSFQCQCPSGYDGDTCASERNECLSGPCVNGGTCTDLFKGYTCQCVPGFTGTLCQTNINDCVGIACPAINTTCIDMVNAYRCGCTQGYTDGAGDTGNSTQCQEVNECLSNPCVNGTCLNLVGSFQCTCTAGYTGALCDQDIDECVSSPCLNGAKCLSGINYFTCQCVPGFTGPTCGVNIDNCMPNPCKNGTCQDLVDAYTCNCVLGFTGIICDVQVNECASGPCMNGAVCNDWPNRFSCSCPSGFAGVQCETNINDCVGVQCQHGGTCIDAVNDYNCQCLPEYMGKLCDQTYNDCYSAPCLNGGSCTTTPPFLSHTCRCAPGFTGNNCQTNINDCLNITCSPQYVCIDNIMSYTCQCQPGYTGPTCNVQVDECASNPCLNGATCLDQIANYSCQCVQKIVNLTQYTGNPATVYTTGFTGRNCEVGINECSLTPSICLNNGVCQDLPSFYQCLCPQGNKYFTGTNCQTPLSYCVVAASSIPQSDQPLCWNQATCQDVGYDSYYCNCTAGWTGPRCKSQIDECLSNPCQYNGTCNDFLNGYTCSCGPGITGVNCETNINECASTPCQHFGLCIDLVNSFQCDCQGSGYGGTFCEVDKNECNDSSPCQNSAPCVNLPGTYVCECYPGYAGNNCQTDLNECLSNPCQNSGTCNQKSNRTRPDFNVTEAQGFDCLCTIGFTGVLCETNINDCIGSGCSNGALCVDGINSYTCQCVPGYTGRLCETQINECTLYNPCQNSAPCTDLVNDYRCSCLTATPPLYGGKNCSVRLTGCDSTPCLNGASCQPSYNQTSGVQSFSCVCSPGFTSAICNTVTSMTFGSGSYWQFNSSTGTTNLFVSLSFMTNQARGVLVLNYVDDGHYLVVYLDSPTVLKAVYAYTLGSPAVQVQVQSASPLNDSTWHTVQLGVNPAGVWLALVGGSCLPCNVTQELTGGQFTLGATYLSLVSSTLPPQSSLQAVALPYRGCMQDVSINGAVLTAGNAQMVGITCQRRAPLCAPDPCGGRGVCVDLWTAAQCVCQRPYRGPNCSQSYPTATFGLGGVLSQVVVSPPATLNLSQQVKLSLFVRTRQASVTLLYLGAWFNETDVTRQTYIMGYLRAGTFTVQSYLDGVVRVNAFPGAGSLADGAMHYLQVWLQATNLSVTVDSVTGSVAVAGTYPLNTQLLVLGAVNTGSSRRRRQVDILTTLPASPPFQGVVQDPRLNGYSLTIENSTSDLPTLPVVAINTAPGPQTDDICTITSPCMNGATCTNVFYNDYACTCGQGFMGKNCSQLAYCSNTQCPYSANCSNFATGFDCIEAATFSGAPITLSYSANFSSAAPFGGVQFWVRTRSSEGVIVHIVSSVTTNDGRMQFFTVALSGGAVNVRGKLVTTGDYFTVIGPLVNDAIPHQVAIQLSPGPTGLNVTFTVDGVTGQSTGVVSDSTNFFQLFPQGVASVLLGSAPNSTQYLADGANDKFKGCLSDVRIAGVQLPFFTPSELVNWTNPNRFLLSRSQALAYGCVGDQVCASGPCVNGGTCTDLFNLYTCSCVPGFTGVRCETNINECLSLPCLNAATCTDGINTVTCMCAAGYTGDRCETVIDQCAPSPCLNNGTCTGGVAVYSCNCAANYTGTNCSISLTQNCNNTLCQNNATCIDTPVPGYPNVFTFNCSCPAGYQGQHCETAIDYCHRQPCVNNATCLNKPSSQSRVCQCNLGYTGSSCETFIEECNSLPCKNGAQCVNLALNYVCACTPGYLGRNCSQANCSAVNCTNGGNCTVNTTNGVDAWQCQCPQYYQGSRCEVAGLCTTHPCANNATCQQNGNISYNCTCQTGWTSANCSVDIDECVVANPCVNGATCTNVPGGYQCTCVPGYTDRNCGTDINECASNPCVHGRCDNHVNYYTCDCADSGYEGPLCAADVDECNTTHPCLHGGNCTNLVPFYNCSCPSGYSGQNCQQWTEKDRQGNNNNEKTIGIIVGVVVGSVVVIGAIVLIVVLMRVKEKRATHGTYSPSRQEMAGSRLEYGNQLKVPPPERLI